MQLTVVPALGPHPHDASGSGHSDQPRVFPRLSTVARPSRAQHARETTGAVQGVPGVENRVEPPGRYPQTELTLGRASRWTNPSRTPIRTKCLRAVAIALPSALLIPGVAVAAFVYQIHNLEKTTPQGRKIL